MLLAQIVNDFMDEAGALSTLQAATAQPPLIATAPVPSLLDTSTPGREYSYVAAENGEIFLDRPTDVAYGASGKWVFRTAMSGLVRFDNETFGDPIVGTVKSGYTKPAAAAAIAKPVLQIASQPPVQPVLIAGPNLGNRNPTIAAPVARDTGATVKLQPLPTSRAKVPFFPVARPSGVQPLQSFTIPVTRAPARAAQVSMLSQTSLPTLLLAPKGPTQPVVQGNVPGSVVEAVQLIKQKALLAGAPVGAPDGSRAIPIWAFAAALAALAFAL